MLDRVGGAGDAGSHASPRTLHYVQFQTQLLRLNQWAILDDLYHSTVVRDLLRQIFTGRTAEGKPQVTVVWSLYADSRLITITVEEIASYSTNSCQLVLLFSVQQRDLMCVRIEVGGEANINIASTCDRTIFSDNDLLDIISHFTDLLKIKKIKFGDAQNEQTETLLQHKKLIGFHSRINSIINQSVRYINACYFDVGWHDARGVLHPLKVSLCLSAPFYSASSNNEPASWLAEEEILLKLPEYRRFKIPRDQSHYRLYVSEVVKDPEFNTEFQVELLTIWMALDGLIGELYNVNKGSGLTGNDVLSIYLYFDKLFNINSTFICDEAKIQSDELSVKIPLRLMMALATGKTWYQNRIPGIRLFECEQFPSVEIGKISQHAQRREAALSDLQSLPISELMTLVKPVYRSRLAEWQDKYMVSNLQGLTACIYAESKQQKKVTSDLALLSSMLCAGIDPDGPDIELDESQPDYWLKSRVRELVIRSRFWVKPQTGLQDESRSALLMPR